MNLMQKIPDAVLPSLSRSPDVTQYRTYAMLPRIYNVTEPLQVKGNLGLVEVLQTTLIDLNTNTGHVLLEASVDVGL